MYLRHALQDFKEVGNAHQVINQTIKKKPPPYYVVYGSTILYLKLCVQGNRCLYNYNAGSSPE